MPVPCAFAFSFPGFVVVGPVPFASPLLLLLLLLRFELLMLGLLLGLLLLLLLGLLLPGLLLLLPLLGLLLMTFNRPESASATCSLFKYLRGGLFRHSLPGAARFRPPDAEACCIRLSSCGDIARRLSLGSLRCGRRSQRRCRRVVLSLCGSTPDDTTSTKVVYRTIPG